MASIIINADKVVLHADEKLYLDGCRASNGAWVDHSINEFTATLIEGVTVPSDWAPGRYRYVMNRFVLLPPPAAAHSENIAVGLPLPGLPIAPGI